jgi:uncharacterized protein YyaL (SSP411 family)
MALLKLGRLTGNKIYIEKSEETVKAFQAFMEDSHAAFTDLLASQSASSLSPTEAIFTGPKESAEFDDM